METASARLIIATYAHAYVVTVLTLLMEVARLQIAFDHTSGPWVIRFNRTIVVSFFEIDLFYPVDTGYMHPLGGIRWLWYCLEWLSHGDDNAGQMRTQEAFDGIRTLVVKHQMQTALTEPVPGRHSRGQVSFVAMLMHGHIAQLTEYDLVVILVLIISAQVAHCAIFIIIAHLPYQGVPYLQQMDLRRVSLFVLSEQTSTWFPLFSLVSHRLLGVCHVWGLFRAQQLG